MRPPTWQLFPGRLSSRILSGMHTVRGLVACVVVLFVLALAPRGRADLVDDGWRVIPIALTLSNAATHGESWGFVISPAPERGMAYVLEPACR